MLEIVRTPKILGSPKSGALGLSLFSLMINPRLGITCFQTFFAIDKFTLNNNRWHLLYNLWRLTFVTMFLVVG